MVLKWDMSARPQTEPDCEGEVEEFRSVGEESCGSL